ncbi:hypothetical protein M3Y99_01235300 [Aphelenchoides fujianensis]|nr:hypothetical protein M3Y99_01235300 [Aphelenchoides fujianensis]
MDCSHQTLFTTFARVQVTPSGPKPAGAAKRTSVAHSLPWAPEKEFHFITTKPSWFRGKFEVRLQVEGSGTDLEACMWTEDGKGKLVQGKKDEFQPTVTPALSPGLWSTKKTSFVCAKIRSIVCPLCSTAAEQKPEEAAEPPSRAAVIKAHTEPPTYEHYVKADDRKDAPDSFLDSQSADLHNEAFVWADEPEQSDEEADEPEQSDEEADDYVPHWQPNDPRYLPPPREPLPLCWREDPPDTDDEPAVPAHPMDADW